MVTAPTFYNLKDQGIYSAGDFFIPQEKYRAAPYTVKKPNNPDEVPAGIPTVYQPQGSADGFDPYNTNMSTIRQDYDPFPSRQAGEIYSKTFNPQSTFDPNLTRAQNTANLIRTYESGTGPGVMKLGNTVFDASKFSPGQRASLLKSADNFIDDARMQYATEGQYVDPYDPNYSSMTEAQKFMDNYPDYYYGPPKTGLEQLASKAINFVPFIGTASRIAGAFADKLPINQRAILENQLRGQGVFTDDIGRIVAGPGGYNTPEGIMAGYNASQMNEGTFDKRTDRISQTLGDKYGISKNDIQGLIDGTVTDEDIENKYGITTNLTSNIRNINLAKQNFITTQNKAIEIEKFKEAERIRKESERQYDPGRHGSTNYGLGSDGQQSYSGDALGGKDLGFGINATTGGPVSNRSGRGRTDYMDGGLADMLEIYD